MKLYIIPILLLIVGLSSCNDDDSFDNNAYNNSTSNTSDVLFKYGVVSAERTLQATMARTENHDVAITYEVSPSLVSTYNYLYDAKAVMLDTACYSIPNLSAVVKAGSIYSSEVKVNFRNMDKLDIDSVYVLPVSIANASSIGVLESKKTTYFVIKGAALINTVANIKENYLSINWANPLPCDSLTKFTMEALIYANKFDRSISTIMGIEGMFLIRLGDSNDPAQLQVATNHGNYPGKDASKALSTNKWTHVAVTYDNAAKKMIIYVNGQAQSTLDTSEIGPVYFGTTKSGEGRLFEIGRSYEDVRYLDGNISECRIWNYVRTQSEIADNIYEVSPTSNGLVAYWKFDEGAGNNVKDYSVNGNNAISKKTLNWLSVALPEK